MVIAEDSLSSVCPGCNADLGQHFSGRFCPHCGFPVNEDAQAQKKFIGRLKVMRLSLEEEWKKINRVKIFLFIIAGLMIVSGLVSTMSLKNGAEVIAVLVVFFILALMFVTLALLVKRYPLPVCIIGLTLYASIILIDAFASDENTVLVLLKGFLLKAFTISSFIYGILAARKVKQMEADLNQYVNIKPV